MWPFQDPLKNPANGNSNSSVYPFFFLPFSQPFYQVASTVSIAPERFSNVALNQIVGPAETHFDHRIFFPYDSSVSHPFTINDFSLLNFPVCNQNPSELIQSLQDNIKALPSHKQTAGIEQLSALINSISETSDYFSSASLHCPSFVHHPVGVEIPLTPPPPPPYCLLAKSKVECQSTEKLTMSSPSTEQLFSIDAVGTSSPFDIMEDTHFLKVNTNSINYKKRKPDSSPKLVSVYTTHIQNQQLEDGEIFTFPVTAENDTESPTSHDKDDILDNLVQDSNLLLSKMNYNIVSPSTSRRVERPIVLNDIHEVHTADTNDYCKIKSKKRQFRPLIASSFIPVEKTDDMTISESNEFNLSESNPIVPTYFDFVVTPIPHDVCDMSLSNVTRNSQLHDIDYLSKRNNSQNDNVLNLPSDNDSSIELQSIESIQPSSIDATINMLSEVTDDTEHISDTSADELSSYSCIEQYINSIVSLHQEEIERECSWNIWKLQEALGNHFPIYLKRINEPSLSIRPLHTIRYTESFYRFVPTSYWITRTNGIQDMSSTTLINYDTLQHIRQTMCFPGLLNSSIPRIKDISCRMCGLSSDTEHSQRHRCRKIRCARCCREGHTAHRCFQQDPGAWTHRYLTHLKLAYQDSLDNLMKQKKEFINCPKTYTTSNLRCIVCHSIDHLFCGTIDYDTEDNSSTKISKFQMISRDQILKCLFRKNGTFKYDIRWDVDSSLHHQQGPLSCISTRASDESFFTFTGTRNIRSSDQVLNLSRERHNDTSSSRNHYYKDIPDNISDTYYRSTTLRETSKTQQHVNGHETEYKTHTSYLKQRY